MGGFDNVIPAFVSIIAFKLKVLGTNALKSYINDMKRLLATK